MAKVKMKCLQIAAPIGQSREVLDCLQFHSVMELKEPEQIDGLYILSSEKSVSQIEKLGDTAKTALNILDKYVPEKGSLLAPLKGLPEMSLHDYMTKSDEADKIISDCYEICDCEKAVAESKAAISRLEASRDSLVPWLSLDIPMKSRGTPMTDVFIGTVADDYTTESLEIKLSAVLGDEFGCGCEVISHQREKSCIFVVCLKEDSEKTLSALRTLGFAYPSDPTKHPPEVRYERLGKEIKEAKSKAEKSTERIIQLSSQRDDIKFVCDYFAARKEKYAALSKISAGNGATYFEGYIPENEAENLIKELENKFTVAYELSDPDENDSPPVLFKNNSFAAAVEPITEMYSMPGKDDIDPNPVMSFFYYMLFGIMLSDAGYGLLMAIGCGIAKFGFKVKGKLKKTVDMYFWCGLATVFWGALFGSWFGDIVTRVADQFFNVPDLGLRLNAALGFTLFREAAMNSANPGSIAIWFEPVNDPTKLLLFSFLFGIIHLFFGVAASMVKMWKAGNKAGAVFDGIPVFLLITGIAPLGANIISADTFFAETASGAKWLALAGAALIVLTAGRDSKNIAGKLGLGLYGLYNAASGWLSDILSYSRLLALGLCTGVIATVINILGTIPEDKTTKLILLIPVFIFGHLVNMAINLIGTYVHTNRLQYVEFFAKFYEGGGKAFTPLKLNTKYYQIKED